MMMRQWNTVRAPTTEGGLNDFFAIPIETILLPDARMHPLRKIRGKIIARGLQ
jgi:hypothetical protein